MTEERALAERTAALSHRGRRRVNQDAVLVALLSGDEELVAVADGMGGHAAGEVASQRALEVLQSSLESGRDLAAAVQAANTAVFTEATTHREYEGMGTTLVALLRGGRHYVVANVGDSRAYRVDGAGIRQLTEDHSFVADAVRSGLSAEEAEKSRWRNAVTRALGTEAELEVDCYGPFDALAPHTVVLCTDGLHRAITEQDLRRLVLEGGEPSAVVRELTACAFDAGSDDNISVALIHFGAGAAAAPSVEATERTAAGLFTSTPPQSSVTAAVKRPRRRRRQKRAGSWTLWRGLLIVLAFIVVIAFVGLLTLAS